MPLARILTRFPQQAGGLSDELRRRGYNVEFSSPELAGRAPADLEIDFEICPEPDALSRASELAEQLHADLAISPGVVEYAGNPAADSIANAAHENLAELEPGDANPQHVPAAADEPVREAEAMLPDSAESILAELGLSSAPVPEAAQHAEVHFETAHQADTAFDDELEIARAAAQNDTTSEQNPEPVTPVQSGRALDTARELAAGAGAKSAAVFHATAAAAGGLWASARHWAQELRAVAHQRSQEYGERFEARRAETRAERQQRLLALEKRRALAQERAAELEAAREAAAARLQELLRERGGLTETQPAPPQKAAETARPNLPARAGLFSRGIFPRRLELPLARNYRPQLEAVMVGIAAACLLFVVGLAVASFHTRPAISTTLTPQPATGVTVRGGGVTVKGGSPGATVTPNPVAQSVAANGIQSGAKPSAAIRRHSGPSDVTIRSFPAAKPVSPRASGTDHVSDDVTIRHFGAGSNLGPGSNPPVQTAPRAQLKRYSDLDN